jgi:hypothetical protein
MLNFESLNNTDFTVPVIMNMDGIRNNQIIKDNLYTEESFIKTLEDKGFIHNTIYDKGNKEQYFFAINKSYGYMDDKSAMFFKSINILDKDTHKPKPVFTDCENNPIMFTELAFYTNQNVDQQYYKIINIDPLIDDEEFEVCSTWARQYFYWLVSQQKCQPYESKHLHVNFEKLTVDELKEFLVEQYDRFICRHSL